MEKILLEKEKEASDFAVESIEDLRNVIEDGWIPELLEDLNMSDQKQVYVRRVDDHIEIGVAQINFIR